ARGAAPRADGGRGLRRSGVRAPVVCRVDGDAGRRRATAAGLRRGPAEACLMSGQFLADLRAAVGEAHVLTDEASRDAYGVDALRRGHPADVVVRPGSTEEVSAVLRLCTRDGVPVVPRGAGTGYTGGAVPVQG